MSESKPQAMHVAEIRKNYNGKQHFTTLVRRTFRDGRKVRHETISNISGLPQDLIESIKVRFKTGLEFPENSGRSRAVQVMCASRGDQRISDLDIAE